MGPPASWAPGVRFTGEPADAHWMTEKKRRLPKKRPALKSPYFLQPGKQGAVTVLRRPAGNRIDAKLCGTMASRSMALALVKQLEKAESVVKDLFLEATDDGIEALDAVLEACRQSVIQRGEQIQDPTRAPRQGMNNKNRRARNRRRGPGPRPGQSPNAPSEGAEDPSAA